MYKTEVLTRKAYFTPRKNYIASQLMLIISNPQGIWPCKTNLQEESSEAKKNYSADETFFSDYYQAGEWGDSVVYILHGIPC